MLHVAQKLATCLLSKLVPLSEMSVGDLEVTYYVLPEEHDNLLPADFRERHSLDPFGEVVGDYQ